MKEIVNTAAKDLWGSFQNKVLKACEKLCGKENKGGSKDIGTEYGCAPHTCKFGQVCSTPTNFFAYFTQSTVFTQICSINMKCALAKSVTSSVFNCTYLSVCSLIIHCLFTNMKRPNFDATKNSFFSIIVYFSIK